MTNSNVRRDGVLFYFTDSTLSGSVEFRDGEMVLDIPGGDGPYMIVGRPVDTYFEGGNAIRSESRVHAKWATVGGEYVGIWREDGETYYFAFQV
jgi:hypothetical protein